MKTDRTTKRLRATVLLSIAMFVTASIPLPAGNTEITVEGGEVPCRVTPSPSWKPRLRLSDDRFIHFESAAPSWVKFTLLACDPETVYFQDSNEFPFHYDFASRRLDPFLGLSAEEFDAVSLSREGQRAILGAVVFPPAAFGLPPVEVGIQLIRQDPYEPEEVVELFRRVRSAFDAALEHTVFYFPTFEQSAAAREHEAFLRENGVVTSSPGRWASDSVVYSEGWALGRLKFFPGDQIATAFEDGRLRTEDILLTDGVPAEIPLVAGVVSLTASTPSSHVAILAQDYGIPFVHPVFEKDRTRLEMLVGRRVVVRAYEDVFGPDLRLHDVEEVLDEETIDELLELKRTPPLEIAVKEPRGVFAVPVSGLLPADARFVGGKAANYGILLKSLPENSRPAIAFTFDLWDAFLDQSLPGGGSLREEIAARLAPLMEFPPRDTAELAAALEGVRELLKDTSATRFAADLENAVLTALTDGPVAFDPERKIRFRSSTNVEDGEQFTGAGLYESTSGCVLDDTDDDSSGPSHCDAESANERGALRAIRRVFASFYNDNAFLARRRWGVDETQVGMAVLVHHSFPDPTEIANGVAVLRRQFGAFQIRLVTQAGADSVSNPEGGSRPEEVTLGLRANGELTSLPILVTPSSRVVLGDTVLDWDEEYVALGALLVQAANAFYQAHGIVDAALDYEYKKVAGEGLVVKQVRRFPEPDTTPSVTPFLLDEPRELETFQGEFGNVLSNHRAKSRWLLRTRSMWLTETNLAEGIYTDATVTFTDGCAVRTLNGDIATFPGSTHGFEDGVARDTWTPPELSSPATWTLETHNIPSLVAPSRSPIITQRDLQPPEVHVEHVEPVLVLEGFADPVWTRSETVRLAPPADPHPGDLVIERAFKGQDGVTVQTSYVWPGIDGGIIIKTYPLGRWVETRIAGLTAEPIVLKGEFSQSYRPGHHNFSEHYVFAPRLEEGLAPEVLEELESRGIHAIQVLRPPDGAARVTIHHAPNLGHACGCIPLAERGDLNGDGGMNIADVTTLLLFLFDAGSAPLVDPDLNGDGGVNIADVVHLLQFLFLGGDPPVDACDA